MKNATTAFPNLLSPIKIGRQEVRNRVVIGSMHTRLEHTDDPLVRQIAFYVERARGGVGLIINGGFQFTTKLAPIAPCRGVRSGAQLT